MAKLDIHLCPETGICSVIKADGTKVDMMPGEVDQLRQASGDAQASKAILAEIDTSFAENLNSEELDQLSNELK